VPASSADPSPELIALQELAVTLFGPRLGISIDETAQVCSVSRDTVYGWLNGHQLIATKLGKRTIVLVPSLLRLMAKNIVTGPLVELAATEHRRKSAAALPAPVALTRQPRALPPAKRSSAKRRG
jgi:hypothetical protein